VILKSFELRKIDLKKNNYFLFYGENNGLKGELIDKKFKHEFKKNTYSYEENEILKNEKNFYDQILTQSFFEKEKLIIISRATDKITKIVSEISERKVQNIKIIYVAEKLDKKSKLRNLFEKDKELICIPFYQDTHQTLSLLVNSFFQENKISTSQEIINLIIERSSGNRQNLKEELNKIEAYSRNKKNLKLQDIIKLTNLSENNSYGELVDFCLAKNSKKILRILNENNFSSEDTILIIRTFLSKTKRLIKLKNQSLVEKNIENVISNFRPPIFWKDKEIIKQQLNFWSIQNIEKLLRTINEIELLIKKNYENSIKILTDFIFSTSKTN
jgi:DNA polymerase III subunit delta